MFGKVRGSRWVLGALMMALLEGTALLAVDVALTTPAQAQFWNDWGSSRRPSRSRSGGFFQNLFGPEAQPYPERGEPRGGGERSAPATDNARAPSPRKTDTKAEQVAPTTSIVVMGDGMADWLAYGLEDAFSDTPEVAIVRKDRPHSGLLRYDPKDDLDWWHVARDILNQDKATYVVMMLGVSDRQNIRERDLAKEAEKDAKEQKADDKAAGKDAGKDGKTDQPAKDDTAAKPAPKKAANGVVEFQSEQWEKIYDRRVDDTIAALKSKGVPVFWVGLPPIRGPKSTAETSYLNNLYRQRAERAGVVYIDVWDGFVDEGGKFTTFGPDYEGQKRRLRSADGVYFTKYGARKLAHYVEREVRRYMSNRVVALPTSPATPTPENGKPAARPLAGPVVPLTVMNTTSDELAGGKTASRVYGDNTATEVLVKGDPLSPQRGRADDFAWPAGSDANASAVNPPPAPVKPPTPGAAAAPSAAVASTAPIAPAPPAISAPAVAPATPVIANPEPAETPPPAPKANEPKQAAKPPLRDQRKTREAEAERRAREGRPVPPRNVQRSNDPFGRGGLFGIFR